MSPKVNHHSQGYAEPCTAVRAFHAILATTPRVGTPHASPRAAVTKDHKPSGRRPQKGTVFCSVFSLAGLKARCPQGVSLPRASRREFTSWPSPASRGHLPPLAEGLLRCLRSRPQRAGSFPRHIRPISSLPPSPTREDPGPTCRFQDALPAFEPAATLTPSIM